VKLSRFVLPLLLLSLTCAPAAAADPAGQCGYYVNRAGHEVPRPWATGIPATPRPAPPRNAEMAPGAGASIRTPAGRARTTAA